MEPEPQPSAPAKCAQHTERGAAATCARCGSFMCEECRAPELPSHCAPCLARLSEDRMVRQVPILAIATMVHGALLAGTGLYFVVFGGFFAANLSATPVPADEGPFAELISGVMFGAIGIIALVHIVPGVLLLWAGWRARTFRSRGLALLALGVGLLTMIGCYCAPTSLGMLVWGAIVLANQAVRDRFAATAASGT